MNPELIFTEKTKALPFSVNLKFVFIPLVWLKNRNRELAVQL